MWYITLSYGRSINIFTFYFFLCVRRFFSSCILIISLCFWRWCFPPVPPRVKNLIDEEKSVYVIEGNSTEIQCYIHGNPQPSVSWLKNGKVKKKILFLWINVICCYCIIYILVISFMDQCLIRLIYIYVCKNYSTLFFILFNRLWMTKRSSVILSVTKFLWFLSVTDKIMYSIKL